MNERARLNAFRWRLFGLFGCAACALIVLGLWFARKETRAVGQAKYEDLRAIADLKAAEITSWRKERIADAQITSKGMLGQHIARWLATPEDSSLKRPLVATLEAMRENEGYANVIVAGPDGRVLLSLNPQLHKLDLTMKNEIAQAIEDRKAVFGDLLRCPVCDEVHLDVAAPILDSGGAPRAVIVFRTDADDYLYPLVQSWPTPSRTSETVLIRKEDSVVVFLNKLRHVPDPALTLRIPLTSTDVPAVRAALGFAGRFEGRDYRGVRVLADIRAVPESPWFLIAKVDSDEMLAEAHYHGRVIVLSSALSVLIMGSIAGLLFNRRQKRVYLDLYRAEKERREAQEEIKATLYSIGDGVIVTGLDGRVRRVNPVAERLTGWIEAEASGMPLDSVFRIVNEETRAGVESPVQRVLREGLVAGLANHTTLIARDGSERPIADSGAPILDENGAIAGVVLVFRDQAEERAAEAVLKRKAHELDCIINSIADGILVIDKHGRVMHANSRFAEMWRIPPKVIASSDDGILLAHVLNQLSDPETFLGKVQSLYGTEAISRDTLDFKDGRIFGRLSYPLMDGAEVAGRIWVFRDVTEHQRAEEELQKMFIAVEQSPVSVVITDSSGNIEYVNPKFTEITGYSLLEVKGRNPRMLKSGETSPEEYRTLWATIMAGREWHGVFHNRKKDGTFFWESVTISPVRDASGAITRFIGVKEDITSQRALEDQLRQAQKMESVGRLAGGVAHDFNNMLEVIIGHAELALSGAEKSSALHENLQEILKAAERSAGFTRQLLAFARKQHVSPEVLDLNKVVSGMLSMLRRLVGAHIELIWQPGDGLWPIRMDPSQIDQIMANLTLNARDAITGAGAVTIATSNVEIGEDEGGDYPGCAPGEYVLLKVNDNGEGIEQSMLDNIFEPFFTTKEVGKGTGLGLATVYGIVKQNGGCIDVASSPGEGATFKICLPRTHARGEAQVEKIAKGNLHGTETVLLVEDEETVLLLAKAILTRFGYRVLSARTPGIALALVEKLEAPVDLVITDIVMPEMNGKVLMEQIEKLRPGIKCLFMSGYTADVIARYNVLEDGINFLQKPFSVDALAGKVRAVLDGA